MLDKMRTCRRSPTSPAISWRTPAAQDHHQSRPGVALRHFAAADRRHAQRRLRQRQITQYFTQLKTYFVVLEILPELQKDLSTLNRLYVKSPLTGGAVPLSSLVDVDSSKVGMLSVAHQGQFPAVTLTFNLRPGVALGQPSTPSASGARNQMPSSIIPTFQGNAQAFQNSLSSEPILIAAALVVVYIILGCSTRASSIR
jgi:multidrug efflux pump subunit AcrB